MNENLTPNNIENNEFNAKNQKPEYTKLITRLKEINMTIDLLEKKYLDKL